ncbi:hypothetical protein [Sulfurimonas diazotrophicus]|uniref:Tetratricopeptide repeat protein n=1 Tax=Sulfurimonas diazotrophicus TaxID=3131939 RepID=A0ABZ3HAP7_9BACT
MKLKIFAGVLTALIVAGCAPMETPVSKELKQQIEHDKNNAMLQAGLAEEYYRQFMEDRRRVSSLLEAKKTILKAEALEPDSLRIKKLAYLIIKDYALGFRDREMFDELYRRFPELKSAGVKVYPPSFIKAVTLDRNGDEKEIVRLYTQAIREEPDFMGSYALLAEFYNYKEHYDLAIDTAKRAIKKVPEYADMHATLAEAYYWKVAELEDQKECGAGNAALNQKVLDSAAQAIRLDHKAFAEPMNVLMLQSYERLGQRELALFLADKVLKADDNIGLYAQTLQINGKLKASMALLQEQQEEDAFHSQLKGMGYFMQQDWKRAIEEYERYFESEDDELDYTDYVYYLSALRMDGQTAKLDKTLKTLRDRSFEGRWQETVIKFMLGERSKEELIEASENRCSTTEAMFVLGMDALARKQRDEAIGYFHELQAQKVYSYCEYAVATYFLENGLEG